MKKKTLVIEGIDARGWECTKCKDMVLHPEDAQRILLLSKLKKGIPVTVGELGNSFVVRIPKEIAELYKLSKGEQIMMKAENDRKIELEVSG
ncbi:MAG: AbrB/MazE/SpoVT family DNA-binding domain-containing protein [Candidatus Aenigmarchaeota archaeon]|nr:AbrB/MazE/SpoVT family DNA-binding domain-containing protein [Candidatus Aenigmarchaeota archaeon]